MELDQSLQSRDVINRQIVNVLDEAGRSWGVKVLRYEVKNLTPPETILRAMQAQITAEREKRALIASPRARSSRRSTSPRARSRRRSSPPKPEAVGDQQGAGRGDRAARRGGCDRRGGERRRGGDRQGGRAAGANLKVAELYIAALGNLAKTNNTMIVPTNLSDVASVVASAMTVLDRTRAGAKPA